MGVTIKDTLGAGAVVRAMGSIEPASSNAWNVIIEIVLSNPAHTDVRISKLEVPHPLVAGFVKHFGDLAGQIADYRFPLPDGREVHIKEYGEYYSTHWDHSSAIRNPFGHLLRDATHWVSVMIALVIVGAFVGGYLIASRRKGKTPPETST